MRKPGVVLVLCVAVLLVKVGNAQVYRPGTATPAVPTEFADWQFSSEPIVFAGLIYYPTNERRFFEPQIMTQVGVYRSVAVYADVTLEPYSVVYLPIGRTLMRAYERRRDAELAGTTGSRLSALPAAARSEAALPSPQMATGTSGVATAAGAREALPDDRAVASRVVPTRVESIPRPTGTSGVWLEFRGARWYSSGPAAEYSSERFAQIGEYRGFPVYRESAGRPDRIWVRVVENGPVAPYEKR